MKKLLSCAAILCAVALVGCSKGNKAENGEEAAGNAADAQVENAQDTPAAVYVEGEEITDAEGNVIGTVVEGNVVDAEGNVLGTVEEIAAKVGNAPEGIKAAAEDMVENAKDKVEGAVQDAKDAAGNAVQDAKDKAAAAVEDVKTVAGNAVQDVKDASAKAVEDAKNAANNAVNAANNLLKK